MMIDTMKLNFGCGKEYKKGFVNVDFNKNLKVDVLADLSKKLPFDDNIFDYVYISHVLEHFEKKEFFNVMEELHRVCKKGALIDIYVPHYTSTAAFKLAFHYSYYGIGTFNIFSEGEKSMGQEYSPARFKVVKEELHLVLRDFEKYGFLKPLNCINFMFNSLGKFWQLLMERCFFIGFDEIYYKLEVLK